MGTLHTGITDRPPLLGGFNRPHPFPRTSQLGEAIAACVDDVIFTTEFQRRRPRNPNPSLELAALKHLTSFLMAEPDVVLSQLATVLVQVCNAGSAGVTLEERRHATETLQCVGAAGLLSSQQGAWVARDSPSGVVMERQRAEIFRRPERFYPSFRSSVCDIEELLIVPWQLSSGRKGVLWVALHERDRHFDPEDLRLASTLADYARQALQRSHSEETRRSCETLASAARLANQLAHEVNNPLQALVNSLYLALHLPGEDHVQEAGVQADRLVKLVRSVLELKREDELVAK